MKISVRRRHALTVADGVFSHKIDYITIFPEILIPQGHQNRIIGSKVTAILLNGWILSIGGASSGRVCACSLRSRLVSHKFPNYMIPLKAINPRKLWRGGGELTNNIIFT